MSIYSQVLKRFKFTPKALALIKKKINLVIEDIKKRLDAHHVQAEVMLGGSAAKGTIMKGDFDCDIFIRFDLKYSDSNISDILENALKGLPYRRIHGSRDYFQMERGKIIYEIIPVLKVRSRADAMNVTDMSPLHVAWISKVLLKKPRLRDHIMLAKVFCKANRVYGAESYINGFSGHVIDILIAYYGSFDALLKNAVNWQRSKVIDIEGHGNGISDSKISPLIVIDPIQSDRNAAAALSVEKFEAFRKAARDYMRKPDMRFFTIRKLTLKEIRAKVIKEHKGRPFFILSAEPLEGSHDVVGTKLLKAFQHVGKMLEMHDFTIAGSGWEWNRRAYFWFALLSSRLAPEKEHMGPPLSRKKDCKRFRSLHPYVYEKGGRLFAKVRRRHTEAFTLLKEIISDEYIKARTQGMRIEAAE